VAVAEGEGVTDVGDKTNNDTDIKEEAKEGDTGKGDAETKGNTIHTL